MTIYKVCPECQCGMYWDDYNQEWECSNCGNTIATDQDDYDGDDDDGAVQSEYTKFDGAITVLQFGDGSEVIPGGIPSDFLEVYDDSEFHVSCPSCPDGRIYYYNGSFVCIDCEREFDREEIEEYAGDIHY